MATPARRAPGTFRIHEQPAITDLEIHHEGHEEHEEARGRRLVRLGSQPPASIGCGFFVTFVFFVVDDRADGNAGQARAWHVQDSRATRHHGP